MDDQPSYDPLFGVGVDDYKFNSTLALTPSLAFPTGNTEAEPGEDDVPALVGDNLKLQHCLPSGIGGHVPFVDFLDDAPLPWAKYERFNSGASGTVYRAQVPESHHDEGSSSAPTSRLVLNLDYETTYIGVSWALSHGDIDNVVKPVENWGKPLGSDSLFLLLDRQRSLPCFVPRAKFDGIVTRSAVLQTISGLHRHVAVKELYDRCAYAKEHWALQLLNSDRHDHIVSLLGSYRHRGKYHLVFPWANSDLNMYWRLNPNPQRNRGLAAWAVKQMMGLADALGKIHGSGNINDDSNDKTGWLGRHGDIKPSNILWFHEEGSGTLKLTDFGLSSFHKPGTTNNTQMNQEPIRYTPAYRAPEFAVRQNHIGQMSDIWGLGCVFLEFVTWFLLGASGVDELASCRADDPEQKVSTGDAFFKIFGAPGHENARLKPGIIDWITNLQNHRHSSCLTNDLLDLVLTNMLVIDSNRRSTARELRGRLARISQSLNSDDSYIMSREARGLDFNDDTRWDFFGHANSSDNDCPQVHSAGGHVNNRKRKSNNETAGSDQTTSTSSKRPHQPKLGCPYLKAGYPQSELSRACMGPGWRLIHHLKEHILRCHTPPAFKSPQICGRCLESFKTQELVIQHLQATPPCLIKSPEIINGKVSLEQAMNLRSMKRKGPDMTEADQWFEIYRIIFPSKELPVSPYHEDITVLSLNTISTESSTGISEYKDHLRRPMSEEEQLALGEKLGSRIGISNPEICKLLAAAFREQQLKDIQDFGRQKLEPVYGIPLLSNDSPKAEAGSVEAQVTVGDAAPNVGDDITGDSEFWLNSLNFKFDSEEFGLEG